MPTPRLSDELAIEAVQALERNGGNITYAARELDLPRATFQNRLNRAAERGLTSTSPVMPGYMIKTVAGKDPDGNWIKQVKEREQFTAPDGHTVKGVSALVDEEGRVIQQWVKTSQDRKQDDLIQAIKDTFDAYDGVSTLPAPPDHTDADLATFYNIADHHLGLYAWGEEAGEDYDLEIGEAALKRAVADLVANAPHSERAVILNLGDFFHSDTSENRTAQSGNPLDVDTRYAKVLRVGVQLMIDCVQLALQKHAHVTVRCLPGNHDNHTALALSTALAAFFSNNTCVTVDCDPSRFFWWRFGKVFVGATHGDMVKPDQMPGVMASYRAQDWGETTYRYAYLGHVHHRSRGGGESCGVIWETFQSLSAKDAWHRASGYSSGRSMVAITHHRELGEVMRHTVQAKPPHRDNDTSQAA